MPHTKTTLALAATLCAAALVLSSSTSAQKARNTAGPAKTVQPSTDIPAAFLPTAGLKKVDLSPLVPAGEWVLDRPVLQLSTTTQHADALKADAQHGERFWVKGIYGAADAEQVVVVIPQYHRSTTQPLDWSSIGDEIRGVQDNIDLLLTRLAWAHGVRCVGTEGSPLDDIQTPNELKQVAQWHAELHRTQRQAEAALGDGDKQRAQAAFDFLTPFLDEQLKRRVRILDGAGLAVHRLRQAGVDVKRFGVEDVQLNKRGVALLKKINAIDEKLALLEPSTQNVSQGIIGEMWLDEYPAFAASVVKPVDDAFVALDTERKSLLHFGDDGTARIVGRYASLAKHAVKATLNPDDVTAYHDYYLDVAARVKALASQDAGVVDDDKPHKLTRRQKRQKKKLERQRAPLQKEYDHVVNDAREAMVVQRVLARMSSSSPVCAVVFGAHHTDRLAAAFAKASTAKRKLGVVVVAPFSWE